MNNTIRGSVTSPKKLLLNNAIPGVSKELGQDKGKGKGKGRTVKAPTLALLPLGLHCSGAIFLVK